MPKLKHFCHLHTKHQVLQQFKPALFEKIMRASKTKSLLILSPTFLMFFTISDQSSCSPVVCSCACMSGHCSHFLSLPTVITAA